jgi:DNA processing protein
LRLARTETVGPIGFYAMLRRFGSARAALEALPRLARRSDRGRAVTVMPRAAAEAELGKLARLGGRLVCRGEPVYPASLAAVEDAPPVLTVLGDVSLLAQPFVAIVGARNASANGRRLARDLATALGGAGFGVISGLARGIDAAAHLGALGTGTVAVQAGGVDIVYPNENRNLYDEIACQGAIVAELPLGSEPQARHFPRRNRVISGMALGVVVVEAAAHSGSLITARYALEQGREIFAVPGSPLDPRCRGSNDLLRHGATLAETAEDVLSQLSPLGEPAFRRGFIPAVGAADPSTDVAVTPPAPADEEGLALVLRLLGPSPVPVDELVRQCQLTAATVATLVLELELAGRVERHPGNLVSLR